MFMVELADKIVEMVQSGNILWIAVMAVIALATKLSKLLEFLESRKKVQIDRLLDAAKCEHLDDNFKDFLSNEIQREYFLYIAKIPAEKRFRDKIFDLHKKADGSLPFFHFKRASSHLKFEGDQILVKITKFDVISCIFNLGVALLFGFFGLAMFMIPAFIKPIVVIQVFTYYGIGTFLVAMATLFAFQTFPLYSAKLIKKELQKSHNKSIQPTVDFPQFSGHASITPQWEKTDAGNDHGEENPAVQH